MAYLGRANNCLDQLEVLQLTQLHINKDYFLYSTIIIKKNQECELLLRNQT